MVPRSQTSKSGSPCSFWGTGAAARRTCTTCSPWTSGSRIPTCGESSTRTPFSVPNGTRISSNLSRRRRASSTAWTSAPMSPSRTSTPPAAPYARRSCSGALPRAAEHYDRYLTFRGVPEEEVARWQKSLMLFYKKMTWKFGRPLVLKSPPHTCRIRLLLEMFPDARFVHIHRDPYAVFRSTRGTIRTDKTLCLQEASDSPDPDARIIRRYRIMYDSFFEERHLIPEGRFHELSFEELERDPVGVVRRIYEHLDIHGFEEFESSLKRYVGSVSG